MYRNKLLFTFFSLLSISAAHAFTSSFNSSLAQLCGVVNNGAKKIRNLLYPPKQQTCIRKTPHKQLQSGNIGLAILLNEDEKSDYIIHRCDNIKNQVAPQPINNIADEQLIDIISSLTLPNKLVDPKIEHKIFHESGKFVAVLYTFEGMKQKLLAVCCLNDDTVTIKRIEFHEKFDKKDIKFLKDNEQLYILANLSEKVPHNVQWCCACDVKDEQVEYFKYTYDILEPKRNFIEFLSTALDQLPLIDPDKFIYDKENKLFIHHDNSTAYSLCYGILDYEFKQSDNLIQQISTNGFCQLCKVDFYKKYIGLLNRSKDSFNAITRKLNQVQSKNEYNKQHNVSAGYTAHIVDSQLIAIKEQMFDERIEYMKKIKDNVQFLNPLKIQSNNL